MDEVRDIAEKMKSEDDDEGVGASACACMCQNSKNVQTTCLFCYFLLFIDFHVCGRMDTKDVTI